MTLQELDDLVAEKVIGWRKFEGAKIPASVSSRDISNPIAHLKRVWAARPNGAWVKMACQECGDMPKFSTDIATAWLVVEKMRGQGWNLCLHDTEPWTAIFSRGGEADEVYYGFAASPALAICEAALRAVGVEISA